MMSLSHNAQAALDSTLVVRVAGFPLNDLSDLRFTRTTSYIHTFIELERWLHAQAMPLSEALYAFIPTLEDKRLRQQGIVLRRAVYQQQVPKRSKLDPDLWAALPPDLHARLTTWLERMCQRQAMLENGNALLEDEWAEKRVVLQQLIQAEPFQQGLLLASKMLYTDLQTRLDTTSAVPLFDRKLELGLMVYLARMAAKTSPFSTFTSSTIAHWQANGPAITQQDGPWYRQSAIEINRWVLDGIVGALTQWEEIRPMLLLLINTSLCEDGKQLRFLVKKHKEAVTKLSATPILQHILHVIRTTPRPTYQTIVDRLGKDGTQDRSAEITRFLDHLINIGLLELDFGIPHQAYDYLDQLVATLQQSCSERVIAASSLLATLRTQLKRFAHAPSAAQRAECLQAIETALAAVYHLLALDEQHLTVPAKNAIYEDTILPSAGICCSLESWRAPLDDLALLQHILGVYEPYLPGRLATTAFFKEQFGSGTSTSLFTFYEAFREHTRQTGDAQVGDRVSGTQIVQLFEQPAVLAKTQLAELKLLAQIRQRVGAWLAPLTQASDQLQRLDRTQLEELVQTLPSFIPRLRSVAFYCQALLQDGEPHLVLNAVQSGFGRHAGRISRIAGRAGGTTIPAPAGNELSETLPVDLAGIFGSSLNLRVSRAAYEIVYPGYVSERAPEEQIPLTDLVVQHDPSTNQLQLRSAPLQRALQPVHLGSMSDLWLPPLYRFLLQIFGNGPTDLYSFSVYTATLPTYSPALAVQAYPRVYLGNVVVERARWLIGRDHFPVRNKAESAFDHMLNIQRWRAEHNIPQTCFVRVTKNRQSKDYKPLYIDFSNYLAVMMLDRAVSKADPMIIMQEAYPCSGDLLLSDGTAEYVSEYIVELTDRGA